MAVGSKTLFCLLCAGVLSWGQAVRPSDDLSSQALRDYQSGRYAQSERGFRELVKRDPSNAYSQFYLGQSLFRQERYAAAVGPFEQARELDRKGNSFSSDQRRVLTDQLAMSYGISGQLKKTHTLLDQAIREDPDYPFNYYNLACAFAEEGDKVQVLKNLDLAVERKANVLNGEQMPDPRADSFFQKYTRDPDFIALMKKLGYK
jgi:predicted Zn-dependent protease